MCSRRSGLVPTPDVPARVIPAGELLQHVSRTAYRGTALHFGRSGGNRYDDPALRFGTLYVGFDLSTALMESVFRQHRWSRRAKRVITRTEVFSRMVRAIGVLEPLSLADLTAPGVMASQFGLNLAQLASRRYAHTQRICGAGTRVGRARWHASIRRCALPVAQQPSGHVCRAVRPCS